MPLSWSVEYNDGTVIEYSEKDKEKFNIAHIDTKKLKMILVAFPGRAEPVCVVHFDDGRKKPIFVIRNQLPNPKVPYHVRNYLVGWQMNVNGENIQSINYIFETIGRKLIASDGKQRFEKIEDVFWVENAGKFDRTRDPMFYSPTKKQLNVVGSKVQDA